MKLQDAVKPLVADIVGRKLLRNQAEALGIFVAAALTLTRSILTDLAVEITRQGFARTVKSALKRLDRWINNPRITVSTAMAAVVEQLVKKRRKKLVIALDWVDIRGFATLVAAATIKGRAVWLMWHSVPKCGLNLNTNRIEEYVLMELRRMLPERFTTIILADRGFHKTRLFTVCRRLHLAYVVRIKADYHVQTRRYRGLLSQRPLAPGAARFWNHVVCGIKPRFTQNIVIYWARKLPEDRDGPWFLATSLKGTAQQIVRLFARRMAIEECFRDKKNVNNGWGLRHMRIKNAANLDRLLLILAIAYLILCGLGLWALRHLEPRHWCANNRPGECGVFTIARRILNLFQVALHQILAEIQLSTNLLAPRWG